MKKCPICNNEIIGGPETKQYCGPECKGIAARQRREARERFYFSEWLETLPEKQRKAWESLPNTWDIKTSEWNQ